MTYCANTQCSDYGNCDLGSACRFFKSASEKPKKREQKPKPLIASEDDIQETVVQYCELKNYILIHIPNEAKRSPAYGAKMRRMGLRRGFPDLLFPTPKKGYHALFIELKRDRTCKPTAEQLQWITYLNKQGYKATVCYGADEAIKTIEEYFREN